MTNALAHAIADIGGREIIRVELDGRISAVVELDVVLLGRPIPLRVRLNERGWIFPAPIRIDRRSLLENLEKEIEDDELRDRCLELARAPFDRPIVWGGEFDPDEEVVFQDRDGRMRRGVVVAIRPRGAAERIEMSFAPHTDGRLRRIGLMSDKVGREV